MLANGNSRGKFYLLNMQAFSDREFYSHIIVKSLFFSCRESAIYDIKNWVDKDELFLLLVLTEDLSEY